MTTNSIETQYLNLLETILHHGVPKNDRTGVGTLSIFGAQLTHSMHEGFPLLTTKKVSFENIASELEWFLSGDTNALSLYTKSGYKNSIWIGDCYKNYLTLCKDLNCEPISYELFIKESKKNSFNMSVDKADIFLISLMYDLFMNLWERVDTQPTYTVLTSIKSYFQKKYNDSNLELSRIKEILSIWYNRIYDLGPIYGAQWNKKVKNSSLSQLDRVHYLLNTDPDSRKIHVNAWSYEDLHKMTLEPCHVCFTLYTSNITDIDRKLYPKYKPYMHKKLSLMWHQRSGDMFLGIPYNIASYALLLEKFASTHNMLPGVLSCSIVDAHLYNNHIDAAKIQLERTPYSLPELVINDETDCQLINYNSYERISAPLNTHNEQHK
jgi:thymidylate synthase